MKKILLLILLLLGGFAYAQPPSPYHPGSNQVYTDTHTGIPDSTAFAIYTGSTGTVYGITKQQLASTLRAFSGGGSTITGGPITSLPSIGFNPGSNIAIGTWIQNVYYASQPPTASLSGGTIYELTVSNQTHNLSYSYGRQSATATISTAVINPGSLNVFGSQPSQPGTTSGTQSVTTIANTNTTYTITVTTSDSKTATATTTDSFLPRLYYGRSSSATPNSTIVLAFAGGSNPLTSSKAQTSIVITASGANYPFFAYPSSEGAINNILDVNGFNVTSSFNQTTVSITNASGYTQNYFIYTLNSATSSNYTITTN